MLRGGYSATHHLRYFILTRRFAPRLSSQVGTSRTASNSKADQLANQDAKPRSPQKRKSMLTRMFSAKDATKNGQPQASKRHIVGNTPAEQLGPISPDAQEAPATEINSNSDDEDEEEDLLERDAEVRVCLVAHSSLKRRVCWILASMVDTSERKVAVAKLYAVINNTNAPSVATRFARRRQRSRSRFLQRATLTLQIGLMPRASREAPLPPRCTAPLPPRRVI